jgi:hypothetical protein
MKTFDKKSSNYWDKVQVEDFLKISQSGLKSARCFIPCKTEYAKIRVTDDAHMQHVSTYRFDSFIEVKYPKMVSPIVVKNLESEFAKYEQVVNEELIEWVFNNRYDMSVSKDQIRETYELFCSKLNLETLNNHLSF